MKVAVLHEFGAPLRIDEIPVPTPEGDWPAMPSASLGCATLLAPGSED